MADENSSQETDETQVPAGTDFEDGQEDPTSETPTGETQDATPEGDETGTPVNQEKVEKKINKLTFEKHEARRKAEAAEAELAEANAKLKELENPDQDITIPEMPDSFDPEYAAKLAARDKALKDQAAVEARREAAKQEQERVAQSSFEENQKAVQKDMDSMFKKATETGIKEDDLKKADSIVAGFIKTPDLARFIISHERSPQLVTYLAANAEILTKISNMSPIEASVFITTDIIPKTDDLMPNKKPGAPPPTNIPSGKAGGKQQSEFLEGVQFE